MAMNLSASTLPGSTDSTTEHASISEQRGEHIVDISAPNIVICGEPGAGKSPIINLIAGEELTHTSNDAHGCTSQRQRYIVSLNGMSCALWDTTGLCDVSEGTVPARPVEIDLEELMRKLVHSEGPGIHLIIYCIRSPGLMSALKRNYDLFYVTVCRKKVPFALIVTGLEDRKGEMEMWWNENEAILQRHGMRFDAHACVTTLDVEDRVIQQRRHHSQRLLHELVVRYSRLPAGKIDPSFMSFVLPMFRNALRRMMVAGRTKKSTTTRRVVNCDMVSASYASAPVPIKHSSDKHLWGTRTESIQIEGRSYEFVYTDKRALEMHTRQVQRAGPMGVVLVFYTSPLGNAVIPTKEVDMLEAFYDIAGGQKCHMVVVLRDCDDVERATRERQSVLASHHKNIQTHFTTLTDQQLNEMIGGLYIEHVEVRGPKVYRACAATKQWVVTALETVISVDYVHFPRKHGRITPGTGQRT